jgi:hypothetical protein
VFERLDLLPSATEGERQDATNNRRGWVTPLLAAAALVASAFAVITTTNMSSPRVAEPGLAPSQAPSFETANVDSPENLPPELPRLAESTGSHIETTTGPTTSTVGESTLSIASHSEVRIHGDDTSGWLVSLERGRVHFDVAPRGERPDFVVQAGEVLVKVVGTHFDVTYERGQTRVEVQEGLVRVESEGHVNMLGAGDFWPRPSDAQADGKKASGKDKAKKSSARRADARAKRKVAQAARHKAAQAAKREREQRAREQFERATQLERSNPQQATRLYRDLSDARGPWAANALYAEARLHMERGEREASQQLLRKYLTQYPRGVNAADVERLLAESTGSSAR